MLMSTRTIWSDNGTIKDISIDVDDFKTGSKVINIVAAQDYLYLGSDFPFNHRYIDVSVANDQASSIVVELWDGKNWKPTVDVIDQTSVGGVTLSQSGIISFQPSTYTNWAMADTNNETNGGVPITGLSSLKIKDLYWARLTFSNDLKNTTAVNYIGNKFSDDYDLEVIYPLLLRTDVMAQFKSGKTDWKLQHLQAAQIIIGDLKASKIVQSEAQIMEWAIFKEAGCHKVAEIAFNAFGKDFVEHRDAARALYKEQMNKGIYKIDMNNNAKLDVVERSISQGILFR